ncbi:MAG TPA: DUF6582 domain-containing protein, partial [Bacteroidota bacterium]
MAEETAARSLQDLSMTSKSQSHKEDIMAKLSEKERDKISDSDFAFPAERKEPISDAEHVRAAIARFDQVDGVSNKERDEAWKRIT